MNPLVYGLGIASTVAFVIFGVLYSVHKSLAVWVFFGGVVLAALSVCLYWQEKIKFSVFVSPTSRSISPGLNDRFVLKLTNNENTPYYQVGVCIRVENGDLSTDDIRMSLKRESKLRSDLGDVTIHHDLFGFSYVDKDGLSVLHYDVYDIDARSTEEFEVNIQGEKIQEQSEISLEVVRKSEEPAKISSGRSLSLINKGNALVKQGNHEDAIGCFRKAVSIGMESHKAYLNWGNTLYVMGKKQDAIEKYKAAIRISPDYTEPHFNWGVILWEDKRYGEAVQQFQEVIGIQPGGELADKSRKSIGKLESLKREIGDVRSETQTR